uniref:Ig-like domain-containing protein n=1 Tax=Pavo cristatus TaxID=9049 RepID=A0A8C9G349_PAVCR
MRIILVWMLFPGVWAVSGPSQVTAHWGSSLSVSCSYQLDYKLYSKGRVSIRDNHTALVFTVTMRDVTPEDAGWYSCRAVKSLWNNQRHRTEVLVSEATAEASDVSPLVKADPTPTSCEEPPAMSQLDITLLLLFLGVKVPVILALLCGAMWLRKRQRSCSPRENLQQSEKSSSTAAPGSPTPQQPKPLAALQHPSGPLPHALPGLSHSASGSSLPAKPQPLLVPPKLHKGRVAVRRSRVC